MSEYLRDSLGRSFFRWWRLRKWVAETKRPRLCGVMSALVVGSGLLLIAEGVLVALLPCLTPHHWRLQHLARGFPWVGTTQWISAALLMLVGSFSLLAEFALKRNRLQGVYFNLMLQAALLAVGMIMVYAGIRFEAGQVTWFGILNIFLALSQAVVLSLCWYTIDPLGLHWG